MSDPTAHGAQVLIDGHSQMIAERLGRTPTLADFSQSSQCFGTQTLPDLDGDGKEEIDVSEQCSFGQYGGVHMLYLSNGGCTKFAGDLVSGELRPLDTASTGVRDLEATWSTGCGGRDFSWSRYGYDGRVFKVVEQAMCSYCDSTEAAPDANSNPRCKQLAPEGAGEGAGSGLMDAERLGELGRGQDEASVKALLGAPARIGPNSASAHDGRYYQEWIYPTKGIKLAMGSESEKGPKAVTGIIASSPCTLTTARGIAIGSSAAAVRKAYHEFRDAAEDDPKRFVAGSDYDGVTFRFVDDKVSEIFIGAGAE